MENAAWRGAAKFMKSAPTVFKYDVFAPCEDYHAKGMRAVEESYHAARNYAQYLLSQFICENTKASDT